MKYATFWQQEYIEERKRELLTDRQLRAVLSKALCEETPGAILVGDQCPVCRFFMFFMKGVVACEFCHLEREYAQESRNTLSKAKLAERGIVIERTIQFEVVSPDDKDSGFSITGGSL